MSDYFGPNQTRVLDSDNRNFEEVIYQKKKPPLSCEVNLDGKIASDKSQIYSRYIGPSGWSVIGSLKDNATESSCNFGDVVCSPLYAANSFKLIALDRGIETQSLRAMVNGWDILVQGTNSTSDENNIIILDSPPTTGYRIDFVFLEVWRKLITPSDTIFKHGNFLYGGQNYTNDLIDPAINIETSLRVQIQYRIRVAQSNLNIYPDGFDPYNVFVQGPLSSPISTCSHAYFSQVPGDIGLWRAGVGDTAAQQVLGTVDGYTYAIPLFAVTRRNTSAYESGIRSNGNAKTLSNYLSGYASDRPDNLYNNWIVATDILDMRHKVSPSDNMKEIAEDAFKKLIRGKTRSVMAEQINGEDRFGTVLVQADAISSSSTPPGASTIAAGDGLRRAFTNAEITQTETIAYKTINDKLPVPGIAWAANDTVTLSLPISSVAYPYGSQITGVQQIYSRNIITGAYTPLVIGPGNDYTLSTLPSNSLTITILGTSSLFGTTFPIYIEYTIQMAAGQGGFTAVPEQMLEFRSSVSKTTAFALPDADIRVRTSAPVITTDGTKFNMLSNRGGNETQPYDFGQQMTYHALGTGATTVQVPRNVGGIYPDGFPILGVISAKVDTTYCTISSVSRDTNNYTVNLGTAVAIGKDVELGLYTGGKFFETNKQGRGIVETYEMAELRPIEAANGSRVDFHVDSTTKAILGIASGYNKNGVGIAYVNGVQTTLVTKNSDLPKDSTKSVATLTFSSGGDAPAGALIEFPLLMKSAVNYSEEYTFFYNTIPYQGLLDSTVTGSIEGVGPAITTTSGSGAITNLTYTIGMALFNDTTVVRGLGTEWLSNVRAGYVIHNDATPQKDYVISKVAADDVLYLTGGTDMSSTSMGNNYTITAKDKPFFIERNIIDRLPTLLSENDSSGVNGYITTTGNYNNAYPVLNTKIVADVQDITTLTPNTVIIGVNTADRGRSTVNIPDAPLGLGNLGVQFENLDNISTYQKSYQTYILNKDNSGKLYLMVVGTETGNDDYEQYLNEKSNSDSVDIFELPGRPLTNRRLI